MWLSVFNITNAFSKNDDLRKNYINFLKTRKFYYYEAYKGREHMCKAQGSQQTNYKTIMQKHHNWSAYENILDAIEKQNISYAEKLLTPHLHNTPAQTSPNSTKVAPKVPILVSTSAILLFNHKIWILNQFKEEPITLRTLPLNLLLKMPWSSRKVLKLFDHIIVIWFENKPMIVCLLKRCNNKKTLPSQNTTTPREPCSLPTRV